MSDEPFLGEYWTVELTNVKVAGESMVRSKSPAIVDTGTSLILGPYSDVGWLAQTVGGLCYKFDEEAEATLGGGTTSQSVAEQVKWSAVLVPAGASFRRPPGGAATVCPCFSGDQFSPENSDGSICQAVMTSPPRPSLASRGCDRTRA